MSETLEKLRSEGIELPTLPSPAYSYVPYTRNGNVLYFSGQISRTPEGEILKGTVGATATVEQAVKAAEVAAINLLARIEEAIGLDNVEQILKLTVWVNSADSFEDQPTVAEGASTLLANILGEPGRHARTALPSNTLPKGALVELDAVVVAS
ncbi:MAG: RidA family protein [Corynebacterium sp.]|uniref:RidA family protein n=1 Tax=Corynebacterium sp. TaxID=1720 RepID=UPI0018179902|nr:RidA family protein [Corynebacterium sp.]NWO17807.1 RidA family protein [Corynebacterium sp.]